MRKIKQTLTNIGAAITPWFKSRASSTADILCTVYQKIDVEFLKIRTFADNNKKPFIAGFGAFCLVAIIGAVVINSHTVYQYMYDGKVLGTVKDQDVVYKTVEVVADKLSTEVGAKVKIDKDEDISFKKVIATRDEVENVDQEEDILDNFTYMQDAKVLGYSVEINGEEVCILESRVSAEELLDNVKEESLDGKSEDNFVEVGFSENVEIKEVETKLENLDESEESLEYIMSGGIEKRTHIVQPNDSMGSIAKEYGVYTQDLIDMNPDVNPTAMVISQEIKLVKEVPLLNVEVTEIKTYKEAIPYDIIYEDTDKTFQGQEITQVEGVDGSRDVTAEVTTCNGEEIESEEIDSTVLEQPTSAKVIRGTRAASGPMGKGYFITPSEGRLSSTFGPRWGRNHNGIDLAAPTGTPIYAAAGGVVVTATSQKSYGNVVKINHGGGRMTIYAHCNELFVEPGDQVLQGDHIASVGNTGNSTGPHNHFEVQIDGEPQNPLKYL